MDVFHIGAGISTATGLAGFGLALYFWTIANRKETNVRQAIEGEGIRYAEMDRILEKFSTDSDRIRALELLLGHDHRRAASLLKKVKTNIDPLRLAATSAKRYFRISLISSILLLAITALFFFGGTSVASDFEKKRAQALLLGYDGAVALGLTLIGATTVQERAALNARLAKLDLNAIQFPPDPAGSNKDAEPASVFAREVSGALSAQNKRLERAFQLGWLGYITTNSPNQARPDFGIKPFATQAEFEYSPSLADQEVLDLLVNEARKQP